MLPEQPGALHVLGRELDHPRRRHPRPQQLRAFRLGHFRQPLLAPRVPGAHAALRQEAKQVATGPRAEPPVQVGARNHHAGRENQPGRFGHIEPSLPGLVAAQAGERLGDLRIRAQVTEGVDGVRPGAERQGAERIEQPMQLRGVRRLERRQALDRQHRPGRPITHLLRHLPHEAVALVHQDADIADGKRVRRHDRSHEVGRLARHDETGEPLVHRQQGQRDAQIENGRLIAAAQVSLECPGDHALGQPGVVGAQLLGALAEARIGFPDPIEVLRHAVHIPPPHSLGQPRREVHAGHTARRRVRPGEARVVRVPLARGKADQIRDRRGRQRKRHRRPCNRIHQSSGDTQCFAKIGHVQVACAGHRQFRGPTGGRSGEWAMRGSNPRPRACEARALTS